MSGPIDCTALVQHMKRHLLVQDLKNVLKSAGLPCSGLKAQLQERLMSRIEDLRVSGDQAELRKLDNSIRNLKGEPSGSVSPSRTTTFPYTNAALPRVTPTYPGDPIIPRQGQQCLIAPAQAYYRSPISVAVTPMNNIIFKNSPFFTIVADLSGKDKTINAIPQNRASVTIPYTLNQLQFNQIQDPNQQFRVLFFAAQVDAASFSNLGLDVAFPQQCEIKIGSEVVQWNTRGLKNKPGTTRPADITKYTIYLSNNLTFTYALTAKVSQKYALSVKLAKVSDVQQLVQRLRERTDVFTKEFVISEMKRKNEESEIEATSINMSLRCPISTLRIELPVRSIHCTHNRCVDATSFLQMQEQAPQWVCPTCNKSSKYEELRVDKYMQDILDNTKDNVESVSVDPGGEWSIEACRAQSIPSDSEDEDEPIEVTSKRETIMHRAQQHTPATSRSSQSREASHANTTTSNTNKRLASQVIDLTLDDDDDPPQRPHKRVNDYSSPVPSFNASFGSLPRNGSLTGSDLYRQFSIPNPPVRSSSSSHSSSHPPLPGTYDNTYQSYTYQYD